MSECVHITRRHRPPALPPLLARPPAPLLALPPLLPPLLAPLPPLALPRAPAPAPAPASASALASAYAWGAPLVGGSPSSRLSEAGGVGEAACSGARGKG